MTTFIVSQAEQGWRLDRVVGKFLPEVGRRGAKRLIAAGQILLNNKPATSLTKTRAGDRVSRIDPEIENAPPAKFLDANDDYAFFFKPRGLHTAKIAGGGPSLEAMLPDLVNFPVRLLQRLDRGTSGLIIAARAPKAASFFRSAEKAGLADKYYLAILDGELKNPTLCDRALNVARGKKVKIANSVAPSLYHTTFYPIRHYARTNALSPAFSAARTLVVCKIHAGQRHQIRAHAAALGHPLLGDPLYGNASKEDFFLVAFRLTFPGVNRAYLDEGSLAARFYAANGEAIEAALKSGE